MGHPSEEELDNLLVRQKNRIFDLINRGELMAAYAVMQVVTEMWEAVSYGYKVKEIEKRIFEELDRLRPGT